MQKKYTENKYIMNDFLDVQIFPSFRTAEKGKRKARFKPSTETQQKLNDENSRKYYDRLIHANFTHNDYHVTLTYRNQPLSHDDARKEMQNFIRRLKSRYKKEGVVLRYVYTTERGLQNGRYHHHIILSGGVERNVIEDAWGKGRCNCDRLQFTVTGIADLAAYISGRKKEKAVAEKVGYRKWSCSKNLVKPEPKQNKSRLRVREVESLFEDPSNRRIWEKLYPGYFFGDYDRAYYNDVNSGIYLSARLYKKSARYIQGRL